MNDYTKPKLLTPIGINNFTGEVFSCFTRGDSLFFPFVFDSDLDVSQWKVLVAFSPSLWQKEKIYNTNELVEDVIVKVDIPLVDEEKSIFEGVVSSAHTELLPCGLCYACAAYINELGITKIIDMCQLEVYPNIPLS